MLNPEAIYSAIKGRMAVEIVKETVTNPVILTKETAKIGIKGFAKAIQLIIVTIKASFFVVNTAIQVHIDYLKTRRKAMVCALLKGENAGEAVENLNNAAAKLWWNAITGEGSGYFWAYSNSIILGDLAKNLFACEAGYDFSVLNGYADTYGEGCDECDFNCDGATVFIDFDNGKQGWVNVAPPLVDNSFGEAMGNGRYCAPNEDCATLTESEIHTGLIGWKQSGVIQIANNLVRSFTQVCVNFGGHGAATNKVEIYVNGVLAMSKGCSLPVDETTHKFDFYGTVLLNIEENKVSSYSNEDLKDGKFYGGVRVVRYCTATMGAGTGEARIFGIAFG